MGEVETARLDPLAVRQVAQRYQSVADALGAGVIPLLAWYFDGYCGGRDHTSRASGLRAALEQSAAQIRAWSETSADVASTLRLSVDRYSAVDVDFSRRLV